MAVPIVIASSDYESPAPVLIYTVPDKPLEEHENGWPHELAFGKNMFRLVHEVTGKLTPAVCHRIVFTSDRSHPRR
jgi:hypothetical protein